MHSFLAVLLLAPTLALSACGSSDPDPSAAAVLRDATPELDPDLVVSTAEESVRLADHRGEVLVLQLAPASDTDAWAALDDAHADLVAEGATVMGIVTEGRLEGRTSAFPVRHAEPGPWAEALGYDGTALAVVIGPAGRLRGRSPKATGDDIVALAAPVLLEADLGAPALDAISALTAAGVESLVRSGAALIDLRADGDPLANALAVPFGRLTPDVLPPDTRAAVVFVGPDAERAAARAADWGYVSVYALLDAQGLEVIIPEEALPTYDPRDDLPRVRG